MRRLSAFILVVATGCSSAGAGSLDRSKSLNALSTTEVQQLCDWEAKRLSARPPSANG